MDLVCWKRGDALPCLVLVALLDGFEKALNGKHRKQVKFVQENEKTYKTTMTSMEINELCK